MEPRRHTTIAIGAVFLGLTGYHPIGQTSVKPSVAAASIWVPTDLPVTRLAVQGDVVSAATGRCSLMGLQFACEGALLTFGVQSDGLEPAALPWHTPKATETIVDVTISGGVTYVVIEDRFGYSTEGTRYRVDALDTSRPGGPVSIGSWSAPDGEIHVALAAGSDHLYWLVLPGNSEAGLIVLDCSDPTHIREVRRLDILGSDVAVEDGRLFVASKSDSIDVPSAAGLRAYDLTVADSPVLIGSSTGHNARVSVGSGIAVAASPPACPAAGECNVVLSRYRANPLSAPERTWQIPGSGSLDPRLSMNWPWIAMTRGNSVFVADIGQPDLRMLVEKRSIHPELAPIDVVLRGHTVFVGLTGQPSSGGGVWMFDVWKSKYLPMLSNHF